MAGPRTAAFLAAALAASLAGCANEPEWASVGVPPLPAAAETLLAPDTVRGESLREGVHYRYRWSPKGPWAVHLVSADLTRCDLQLRVVPAVEEDGSDRRRMTVTEMRPSGSVVPVAGVNGDFFMEGGLPIGPEVTAGTRRASSRPAFVWTARRTLWIGPGERNGRVMVFGADTVGGPDHEGGSGEVQVVGGYPELLDGGLRVGDLATGARPAFAAARHPRTAVGYDNETALLWLAVVDGRQEPYSDGMTLPELADLLESLGVDEALNLDGGGSSAMSLGTRLANRPSDMGGERRVGNSLWLVEDASGCAAGS